MLNDVILSVVFRRIFMLAVVMLSVEMLSVLATQNIEQHN
jgi:hypothetical protein